MNAKSLYLTLALPLCLFTTSVGATIIHCTDNSGKMVYTDNPRKCADKEKAQQQVIQAANNKSYNFYNEIPDLLQTKTSAGFAGGGTQFCAPVAVSNSLVWLEKNTDENYQIELVKKLSSSSYMNTNLENGTDVFGLTNGVHKYAMERWGSYKKMEYSGWSNAPAKFRSNLSKPTLDWMLSALHPQGSVWINIGWYKTNSMDYQRVGGHWVTLVGYEQGRLVIHDPSPRAGKEASSQFVALSQLTSGKLIRGTRSTSAQQYFILGDGFRVSSKADVGIIDGAVIFEL